jgi:UDP-N-acetylmuramate--alanine ligase
MTVNSTHIHFMGISGIGVSGLARICMADGLQVSGCDCHLNNTSAQLQQGGVVVYEGHSAEHIQPGVDTVVYTSAVPPQHPELERAHQRQLQVYTRGQFLAELANRKRLVAVAGAHGKTTTSAMASQLLMDAHWDPTVVVGGYMLSLQTNARVGSGAFMVVESDESDGSFLHLRPEVAIVTNIDREHLNYYRSFEQLIAAFEQFSQQVSPQGAVIVCGDDPLVRQTVVHPHRMIYGLEHDAHVTADRIECFYGGSRFRAYYRGRSLGSFQLQVPGRHNVLNSLAIIALGLTLDIPMVTVRDALAGYRGTKRRFQRVSLPGDIEIVEDYAHHPSEIRATLAAGALTTRHRLAVFQPHRFSRVQYLEEEFAQSFKHADGVIVTDIYGAMETPIPGLSGERLAHLIEAQGHPCVRYVPKDELQAYLSRIARSGDTIFFLGAGDIGELCHAMATQLHSTECTAS